MRRKAGKAAVVVLALLATLPAMGGCSPWMVTGIHEIDYSNPANRDIALTRTKNARATIARTLVYWSVVAPTEPPSSSAARDPNWSGYRWASYDAQVRAMKAAGLEPMVVILRAPTWAEGSDRPSGTDTGAWKPSPSAFRDFAEAAARRYDGTIQPRVQYWQAWNEPNVGIQLAPEWRTVNGVRFATGPLIYKNLLNAFYDGVKAANTSNIVLTAGAAPQGYDPQQSELVMRPAYFWRRLLCIKDGSPPRPESSCPGGPARFDIFTHHPYTHDRPGQSAANPDDVAIADMARLTGPLKAAISAGYVYPRTAKNVWVTEVSYDSNPPDPTAPSIANQATWLEGAMYRLWKQGVTGFVWFGLRDRPNGPLGWYYTLQSGLYLRGSTIASDLPKPSLTAFRFPFTAYRTSSAAVQLWGIAPQASKPVVVERQSGGSWSPVATVTASDSRMFVASLNIGNGAVLRAVQNGQTSLSWTTSASGP
jgi:hypothetical protein